jgi:hypothetical protein
MTTYDTVCLAENEWGNTVMREVAEEWFAAHPACQFVEVREHAGWWLGYHRSLEVIGTANDGAVMRKDRPRPQASSGVCHRRPVIRPDLREVVTLEAYKPIVAPLTFNPQLITTKTERTK